VNTTPDRRSESATVKAARELVQLQAQVEQVRATLAELQQDVVAAKSRLGSNQAAQLLEANEQLVFAMLRAKTDIETGVRVLREVSRLAELDPLTALPNRALLLDRFAHAIANAKRRRDRLALLFLDLNNFKQVNDTLGHAVGDEVLKLAAHCLASSVREVDIVSRLGGDEFLILLTDVSQASDAAFIADKVIAALGAPSRMGDHVLRLTASIGISIYPEDGEDAETLIDRADAAMYRAKRHGLGGFAFHGQEPTGERSVALPVLAARHRPLTHYERARAEHERRHAQLREANEQLVLDALNAQELQVAAEQAQRRQTEFLAVLAHELRTPLAPIYIAATLLSRVRTGEALLPRLQVVVERQVAHMTRLVGDLLDLARVSTGKLRLERRAVDMADLIDQAVDACRPAMDTRLQHFGVHVPARALHVHGDPVCLTQVLSNLLDNASKYTPESGEIGLVVVVVDDAIVITVSDSGIGITAEALPTIFEPFVQDIQAIGFNEAGLGIGLTVVRELVKAHSGTVVASSAGSGLGSQFVVTLPLARAPYI